MPRAASCPTAACYALPDRRVKAAISLAPRSSSNSDGASLYSVPNPPNNGGPPFVGRMLLIPSGQVLFADGSNQIFAYTPVWRT